jgi:50S ribosomal subunit-associated GTPase HflX
MKRIRLSTLMLLVVIAAMGLTLTIQHRRAARREADLQARLAQSWPVYVTQKNALEHLAKDAVRYRYTPRLRK